MADGQSFANLPRDQQVCAAARMLGPQASAANVSRVLSEAAANPVVAATLTRHHQPVDESPNSGAVASVGAQIDAADAAASGGGSGSGGGGAGTGTPARPLPDDARVEVNVASQQPAPTPTAPAGPGVPPTVEGDPRLARTFPDATQTAPGETPLTGGTPGGAERVLAAAESGEDLSGFDPNDVAKAAIAVTAAGTGSAAILYGLANYYRMRPDAVPPGALVTAMEGLEGDFIGRAPPGTPRIDAPGTVPTGGATFVGPGPQLPGAGSPNALPGSASPGAIPGPGGAALPPPSGGGGGVPPVIPPGGAGVPPTPAGDPRLSGSATGMIDNRLLLEMEKAAAARSAARAAGTPQAMDPSTLRRLGSVLY